MTSGHQATGRATGDDGRSAAPRAHPAAGGARSAADRPPGPPPVATAGRDATVGTDAADTTSTADGTDAADGGRARDAAVETIHRELTVFARRARATAGRMHPQLSLVAYTLLSHLEERGGCRATDLAAHYALDKSTVSRQVAALERDGLVRRRVDPEDHRGQVLDLTPEGTGILAEVTESRRAAFKSRLTGWPPADLVRFAAFLRRYNEAAAQPDDPTAPLRPTAAPAPPEPSPGAGRAPEDG